MSVTTNLSTLTACDAATGWSELASPHSGGSAPAADTENYIHNSVSVSQVTGQSDNQDAGIQFDNGSSLTWSGFSNWVFLFWTYYSAPTNLKSWANGGMRLGFGPSEDNLELMNAMGNDFENYPYGGWQNTAIDPDFFAFGTPDQEIGTGSDGTYQVVAVLPNITSSITKGAPLAVDVIRYGRADIVVTGTETFTSMAAANDADTARWGLFQASAGVYIWKGLMTLGTSGTALSMTDSNKVIRVQDTPRVLTGFNKIEINNASSSISWSSITFIGVETSIIGTKSLSQGNFTMVDNATVSLIRCSFSDMGDFNFLSNATITNTVFRGCKVITHGGAEFESCIFSDYQGGGLPGTSYLIYSESADIDGKIDNCTFIKGSSTDHAIKFNNTAGNTHTLRGLTFSGYNASNEEDDSTILFANRGSDTTWTINLIGCTGNISYTKQRSTDTVNLIINPVTTGITVKDLSTGTLLEGSRVLVWPTDGTNFPYEDSVSITGSGTTATVTHTAHGLSTGDNIIISGANEDVYNGSYQITVTGTNTYTYTTNETIGTSPATGTIKATFAFISGVTNSSGYISDSRTISSSQPISGRIRLSSKTIGSETIYFQQGIISGTIDNENGFSATIQLVRDM